MSASNTTSLGNSAPSPASALPKASRRESLLAIRAGLDIEKVLDLGAAESQRLKRLFGLGRRQLHAAMPGGDVFHIGHAFALDGVSNQDAGAIVAACGILQRRQDGANVMTVDLLHRPAKG